MPLTISDIEDAVRISNSNSRPKTISPPGVTEEVTQGIVEADGGFESTAGFDPSLLTTSYTQSMVDDGQWLRFGFDTSSQVVRDVPGWADPKYVEDPKGVGLFGGEHLPSQVSSLFDFGYDLKITDIGTDQSPSGTFYPTIQYASKAPQNITLQLQNPALGNNVADPALTQIMVDSNPIVGEMYQIRWYEPSSTEVPSSGTTANLENVWEGRVQSFDYDLADGNYTLVLNQPNLLTAGHPDHRTAQNNAASLLVQQAQGLAYGQPAPAPTTVVYDLMHPNAWNGSTADFYLDYYADVNGTIDLYYTIDESNPPAGYSNLVNKVWEDGDTIQFDISATAWDSVDPSGVFTLTLTYSDAVFGPSNPAGSSWDIESDYLNIYLADIGTTYAGQSAFTVEPAAAQSFNGDNWYVVGNNGQPDVTQLDATLELPNPLDYSTTFSAEVSGGSLNYTATPGSFDFTDCSAGDYVECRFDFDITPQVADTVVEVGMVWMSRDEEGSPVATELVPSQPMYFGVSSVGETYSCSPVMSKVITSQQDVNGRALVAVKGNNVFTIAPTNTQLTILR